jgi:phage virion morphogenesis protein
MTGSAIIVDVDTKPVSDMLKKFRHRMGSLKPAMKIIGQIMRTSIVENFQKGGRPDAWAPLSDETLLTKKGSKILIETGFAGGLMGSIHSEIGDDYVMVGTDKKYAAIHQFGGKTGRGSKVTIPARPFLLIQDEDIDDITAELNDYLMG